LHGIAPMIKNKRVLKSGERELGGKEDKKRCMGEGFGRTLITHELP
jgi:hypothetical protein